MKSGKKLHGSENRLAHFSRLTRAHGQMNNLQHLRASDPRQECGTPAGRDAGAAPSAGDPRAGEAGGGGPLPASLTSIHIPERR